MTLRLIQLPLHLQPDEALTLITFLDQLRESLCNHYAEAIRSELDPSDATRCAKLAGANTAHNLDHPADFDDPIPF
jgi:hypothetical protein